MNHPLTDEMCYGMCNQVYSFPDRMRTAYDKGFEDAIECIRKAGLAPHGALVEAQEMTHPALPTQEQFSEWDSEYFDGERQNFDIMMIKAFQAGADWRLDECVEELECLLSVFQVTGATEIVELFKSNLRPQ